MTDIHFRYVQNVLNSCTDETQVYQWINWVDRLCADTAMNRQLHGQAQIKLEELYQELKNVS